MKRAHGISMPDHPTSLDVMEPPPNTRDDGKLAINIPRNGTSIVIGCLSVNAGELMYIHY